MKVSEKLFQENHTAIPETTTCSVCKKECGSYAGLSKYINMLHAELSAHMDSVEGYRWQLNKLLLIKRIMDVAIKYGDGATLSLIMKFINAIIISFSPHERNCDECFVNNKGNAKSNMATDLAI